MRILCAIFIATLCLPLYAKEYRLWVQYIDAKGNSIFSITDNYIEEIDPEDDVVCQSRAKGNAFICDVQCDNGPLDDVVWISFKNRPQYARNVTAVLIEPDYCQVENYPTEGKVVYTHNEIMLARIKSDIQIVTALSDIDVNEEFGKDFVDSVDGMSLMTSEQIEAANRLQNQYAEIAARRDLSDELGINRLIAQENSATITTILSRQVISTRLYSNRPVEPGVSGFLKFRSEAIQECGSDCGFGQSPILDRSELIGSEVRASVYKAAKELNL